MVKNTFYASIFNLLKGDTNIIIIKQGFQNTYKCEITIDRDEKKVFFSFSTFDENNLHVENRDITMDTYPGMFNLKYAADGILCAYISYLKSYSNMSVSASIKDEEVEEMF